MFDSTRNIYKEISNTEMILYCGNTIVVFDTEDYPLVSKWQWSIGSHGYATSGASKNQVLMHRLIMNADDNRVVDHINRVKIDNRKCNLRLCSHKNNAWNRSTQADNKTGYKGICKLPNGKYQAQIGIDRKQVYLGQYTDIEEAIRVYDSALKLEAGEFACVNNEDSVFDKDVFHKLNMIRHNRRMPPATRERIHDLRKNNMLMKDIAIQVGFSESSIQRLLNGRTYRPKASDAE
jgi:hypothetical protein